MSKEFKMKGATYKECLHIKGTPPDNVLTEEMQKELNEYHLLKSYEMTLFNLIHIKHYSLNTNEKLKCRWEAYRNSLATRVHVPFKFPESRHLHFHNGAIKFLMTETNRNDVRHKLKPGPGVDDLGQIPIPYELHMKREKSEPKVDEKSKQSLKKPKKSSKIHKTASV